MLEIINQRYMKLLFEISNRQRNISELAKRGDLTISATSTLISRWCADNVVNKTKSDGSCGREIIITLTEYGQAQVKLLKELNSNYNKNKKYLAEEEKAISFVSDSINEKEVKNAGKN